MKRCFFLLFCFAAVFSCARVPGRSDSVKPALEVNVFNGTDYAGNTYPGATVPYGAVQLSPDTDAGLASGYHYSHDTILGFSHTHLSGTGCPDLGDFQILPGVDEVQPLPLRHQDESARPGYYRVAFPQQGMTAEQLKQLNGFTDKTAADLKAGQKIRIR